MVAVGDEKQKQKQTKKRNKDINLRYRRHTVFYSLKYCNKLYCSRLFVLFFFLCGEIYIFEPEFAKDRSKLKKTGLGSVFK
jgi:hypothetical protein